MYEHRYLENIQKLYKYAGKCDDQHKYNSIIEAAMVSTTEIFTDNSPISYVPYVTVNFLLQENHLVNFLKYWM